jgi:hypothetical protein
MLPSGNGSSSSSSGCSCGSLNVPLANDPYIIDMIKLADDRICQLQNDLETIKQTNEILETKVSNYKNQVRQKAWCFISFVLFWVLFLDTLKWFEVDWFNFKLNFYVYKKDLFVFMTEKAENDWFFFLHKIAIKKISA